MAAPSLGFAIGATGQPKDYTAQTLQGMREADRTLEAKKAAKKAGEDKELAEIYKGLTVEAGKYNKKQVEDVKDKMAGYILQINKARQENPSNWMGAVQPIVNEAQAYIATQQAIKKNLDDFDNAKAEDLTPEQLEFRMGPWATSTRLSEVRGKHGKNVDEVGTAATMTLGAYDEPIIIRPKGKANIGDLARKIANDANAAYESYESGVTPLGEHQLIYTKGKTTQADFVRKNAEQELINNADLMMTLQDANYQDMKRLGVLKAGQQDMDQFNYKQWMNTVEDAIGRTRKEELRAVPSEYKGAGYRSGEGAAGTKFNIDPGKETFIEYKGRGGKLSQVEFEQKFPSGGAESIKFTRTDPAKNTIQPLKETEKDPKTGEEKSVSIEAIPIRLVYTDGKWQLEVEKITETAQDGTPAKTEKKLIPYSGANRETVEGEYKDKALGFGEYLKEYNKRWHKDENFGLKDEPETLEKMEKKHGIKGTPKAEKPVKKAVSRYPNAKIGNKTITVVQYEDGSYINEETGEDVTSLVK